VAKNFSTLEHQVWLPYKLALGPTFYRFYEGLKEEKILGNQCPKCGKILVPPRTFCPWCFVDMEEWKEVSQQGSVVTWCQANYKFFGMPTDPPFVGALIRLDGTDCNFLHLIGNFDLSAQDLIKRKIKRGTRVKAVWSDIKKGHMLDIKHFELL
jgi:uncharacterized OB-fold protein